MVETSEMKYIIDTEFIDTPTCSALISLAIVREDGEYRYFEFDYPESEMTPWLRENVVPHLTGERTFPASYAAHKIEEFIGDDKPEFWAYYGAYDWYWFCRLWGGFMSMPVDVLHGIAGAHHAQQCERAGAVWRDNHHSAGQSLVSLPQEWRKR